jgi:hypothetical protein
MAKAYKCDRCGKLEEVGPVALLSLVPPKDSYYMENYKVSPIRDHEICPACFHKLTKTKP